LVIFAKLCFVCKVVKTRVVLWRIKSHFPITHRSKVVATTTTKKRSDRSYHG